MTLKDLKQESDKESLNKYTEEIELNEKHLSLIYDTLSDAIYLLAVEPDDCFRFVSVNQAFLAVTGLSREQVVGKRIEQVLPKTAHALVISKYKEAISENKTVFWEEVSTYPTGELVSTETVTPVWNAEGVCTHLVGTMHNLTGIRRGEDALQESEEKYRTIYDSSKDAVMMVTPEEGFLSGNPATIEMFGCKDEKEFISRAPYDLSPQYQPDGKLSSGKAKQMMAIAMEKGSHFFEWTHKRMDDQEFPTTVLLTRMELQGRRVLQATVRDITERKQAEDALQKSEEKYRDLAELLPEVIFETDLKGNITYANQIAFDSFGYTQSDFDKGLNALQMLIPEDRDGGKENMQRVLSGETIGSKEYTAQRKDKTTFQVIINSRPIIHENKPVGLRGGITDITERKQVEEALRDSEKKFRLLAENSIDCIWILDTRLRFTYLSPSAERILGYKPEQMVGTNLSSHFKKKEFLKIGAPAARAIKNYKTFTHVTFETKMLNSKNDEVNIEITSKVLLNSQGKLIGLQGTTKDITERKRAEEELQERMNELETFYRSTLGREGRVIELKQEVNELLEQLGKNKKYGDYSKQLKIE